MTLRTLLITSAAAALLSACGNAGLSSDATPPAATQTSEFKLDFEAFTLDNGLQVILQRDASDPIVAVSTVIHAGSSR